MSELKFPFRDEGHFCDTCRRNLAVWYSQNEEKYIHLNNVVVLWYSKTSSTLKALVATDTFMTPKKRYYGMYEYNLDTNEYTEDIYTKVSNTTIKSEDTDPEVV